MLNYPIEGSPLHKPYSASSGYLASLMFYQCFSAINACDEATSINLKLELEGLTL